MKLLATLFFFLTLPAVGEESYFFDYAGNAQPTKGRIEGNLLHFAIPIKRIAPPQATSIFAFHQGLGPGREYQIQIKLKSDPN